jgi:hypothetical protein
VYEGINDRIGKGRPFSRREEVCKEIVSMGKVAIHTHLILDVRKKTNGSNVDLE